MKPTHSLDIENMLAEHKEYMNVAGSCYSCPRNNSTSIPNRLSGALCNPYRPINGKEHQEWFAGWEDAKIELRNNANRIPLTGNTQ